MTAIPRTLLTITIMAAGCASTSHSPGSWAEFRGTNVQAPGDDGQPASDQERLRSAWVRPKFETESFRSITAGTAFAVIFHETPLLLTAHHLLGTAGGLPRDLRWDEVVSEVTRVTGHSTLERGVAVAATKVLPIPGAVAMSDTQLNRDLAAFFLDARSKITTLVLARETPAPGDPVQLVGKVIGRKGFLHDALVVEASREGLFYQFEENLELRATSGAPVINAAGEVVAVNLGGGEYMGATIGVGAPSVALSEALENALRASDVAASSSASPDGTRGVEAR